jgi:regulator of ribonuclease activity A
MVQLSRAPFSLFYIYTNPIFMSELHTTDLCDAYSQKVRVAAPIGFRDYGGTKNFSGKIYTVKCLDDNSFVRKALEGDGTGKVLVVDGGGSLHCALLGDMLGELAIKNKWRGIIVNGCIRDSAAIGKLALGVKALNTMPRKSEKKNAGEENLTVRFAEVDFIPNEFIYCDEDGIIVSQIDLSL